MNKFITAKTGKVLGIIGCIIGAYSIWTGGKLYGKIEGCEELADKLNNRDYEVDPNSGNLNITI